VRRIAFAPPDRGLPSGRRIKRLLLIAGVASVVGMAAWTGFGVLALARLARDGEAVSSREAAVERDALALATLADEVETLHADVRALAQGFGAM
jgi:hypothetical protein